MSRNKTRVIEALKSRGFTGTFELFFWHNDGWYLHCDQTTHGWIGQNVSHVLREINKGSYDKWVQEAK